MPPETISNAAGIQCFGQGFRVFDHGLRVKLEGRVKRLAERHRLGGDDMHQRPALHAGEDGGVELLGDLLVIGEDRAAARPAQGLVRGRRDHVGMREWARMHAAGHKAGEMRHVDHQVGADIVGDLAEAAEIDDARIGGAAGDDHLRPMLFGEPLDLVHVDQVIVPRARHKAPA